MTSRQYSRNQQDQTAGHRNIDQRGRAERQKEGCSRIRRPAGAGPKIPAICQGIVVISMPENHSHSCPRANAFETRRLPVIRGHIS